MTDPALPPDHYRLHVMATLPPSEELIQTFGGAHHFLQPKCEWRTRVSWIAHASEPGERIFFLKRFGTSTYPSNVMEWAERAAYRPATHLELIAFALAYPGIVLKDEDGSLNNWIMALGSTMQQHGHPNALLLIPVSGRLHLDVTESRDRSFPFIQKGRYLLVKTEY